MKSIAIQEIFYPFYALKFLISMECLKIKQIVGKNIKTNRELSFYTLVLSKCRIANAFLSSNTVGFCKAELLKKTTVLRARKNKSGGSNLNYNNLNKFIIPIYVRNVSKVSCIIFLLS